MPTSGVKTRAQTRRDASKKKGKKPPRKAQAEECAICLDDIDGIRTDNVDVLKCGHIFHSDCMARWEKQCKERSFVRTCPYCRKQL
jgi:hypothetical protein